MDVQTNIRRVTILMDMAVNRACQRNVLRVLDYICRNQAGSDWVCVVFTDLRIQSHIAGTKG